MFDVDRAVEVISRPLTRGLASGYGSGYYLGAGLVVTCAHVLPTGDGYERLLRRVTGEMVAFEVVWRNAKHDVALLAVAWPQQVPAVRMGVLPRFTTEGSLQFLMYGWPRAGDVGEHRNGVQVDGVVKLPEAAGSKTGTLRLQLPPTDQPNERDDILSTERYAGARE